MPRSNFLARLMGPAFVAMAAALLLNRGLLQSISKDFLGNYTLIYLTGGLALVAGLAIVNTHNVWTRDWRVIITIFGWLAAIGGAVRMVWPQGAASIGTTVLAHPTIPAIAGVLWLALGLTLCWFGYRR